MSVSAFPVRHPYYFIALLAGAFMAPAFLLGPFGDDLLNHTVWSQEFAYEFWHGQLYPRWLSRMNSGCGGPDFFYYYPLPYYLTALFSFADNPAMPGWYPLMLAILTVLVLMGIAAHVWLCSFIKNRTACLCGAIMYMFSVSSIVSIYEGSYYSSFVFLIFVPLLMLYARRLAQGKSAAIPGFALSMAGLFASSLTATITAAWLPVIYFLWHVWFEKKQWKQSLVFMAIALLLAVSLAAIYLWPMLSLRDHTIAYTSDKVVTGEFLYSNNFLFEFAHWPRPFVLPYAVMSMVELYILLTVVFLYRRTAAGLPDTKKREPFFWLCAAVIIFFMMIPFSAPLWRLFPILQIAQRPLRFGLNLYPVILAFFAAWHVSRKPQPKTLWSFGLVMMAIIVPSVISLPVTGHRSLTEPLPFTRQEISSNSIAYTMSRDQKLYAARRVLWNQFFPTAISEEWGEDNRIEALAALCQRRVHVESGSADVVVKDWRPRHIELEVNAAAAAADITVSQFMFPGWTARDAQDPAVTYPIAISPEGAGLIRITVPAGEHRILLQLEALPSERRGIWLSLLALCVVLTLLADAKIRTMTLRKNH